MCVKFLRSVAFHYSPPPVLHSFFSLSQNPAVASEPPAPSRLYYFSPVQLGLLYYHLFFSFSTKKSHNFHSNPTFEHTKQQPIFHQSHSHSLSLPLSRPNAKIPFRVAMRTLCHVGLDGTWHAWKWRPTNEWGETEMGGKKRLKGRGMCSTVGSPLA